MRRALPPPVCATDRSSVRTAPAPSAVNKLRNFRREVSGAPDRASPLSLSKLFESMARNYDERGPSVSRFAALSVAALRHAGLREFGQKPKRIAPVDGPQLLCVEHAGLFQTGRDV